MNPVHPLAKSWTDTLREDRAAVILADRLGYSDAFIGEHLTDKAENITSSAMFLASLASETTTIRLGTGTANLSHMHPVLTAAHIAMLDHLLEGRLNFAISPGVLPSDAEALGLLDADRRAMFAEAIDAILAIWAGEAPYDIEGTYWKISTARSLRPALGVGYLTKPYQAPHPPIFGAVIDPSSKGLVKLAERGWKAISSNLLPQRWLAGHWPSFAEGRALANLPADPEDWYVARSIFVADDEKTARAYGIESPQSPYRFYYQWITSKSLAGGRGGVWKRDPGDPDSSITIDSILDQAMIVGTPAHVTEQILALIEEVGIFGTLVYVNPNWTDERLGRRSMELMATKVMPAVNDALKAKAAE